MSAVEVRDRDVKFLEDAVQYLESPSYLTRVAALVDEPREKLAGRAVPDPIARLGEQALMGAMGVAANTILTGDRTERESGQAGAWSAWTDRLHVAAAAVAGGTSGLFGMTALNVELPLTTGIMFRSIAAIADELGEDIHDPAVRLECLSIFAQCGPGAGDAAAESSYLTTRVGLAQMIQRGAELVQVIHEVASQFNITVMQRYVASNLPTVNAATGALVNAAFTDHFNTVARYHFGIRKLERQCGQARVQELYRAELRRLRGRDHR
jgi:hypothetical protein